MAFYTKLPDELKVMIWEAAVESISPGVHFFRLGTPLLDEYGQLLRLEPMAPLKDDVSAWLQLRNIAMVSKVGRQVVHNAHKRRNLLWKAPPPRGWSKKTRASKLTKRPQDPRLKKASVDTSEDLVCFLIGGLDFDVDWLSIRQNRQQFKRLRKIGVRLNHAETRTQWMMTPFHCICVNSIHNDLKHCPVRLVKFLRIFKDMEAFYFVVQLTKKVIDTTFQPPAQVSGKAASKDNVITGGTPEKKADPDLKALPAAELIEQTLGRQAEIAKEKHLEVFADRAKPYIEVRKEDSGFLKDQSEIWELISQVQERLRAQRNGSASGQTNAGVGEIKVKLLICDSHKKPRVTQANAKKA